MVKFKDESSFIIPMKPIKNTTWDACWIIICDRPILSIKDQKTHIYKTATTTSVFSLIHSFVCCCFFHVSSHKYTHMRDAIDYSWVHLLSPSHIGVCVRMTFIQHCCLYIGYIIYKAIAAEQVQELLMSSVCILFLSLSPCLSPLCVLFHYRWELLSHYHSTNHCRVHSV